MDPFSFPESYTEANVHAAIKPLPADHQWNSNINWKKPLFTVTVGGHEHLLSAQQLVDAFDKKNYHPDIMADIMKDKGLVTPSNNFNNRLHILDKAARAKAGTGSRGRGRETLAACTL